MIIHYNILGCWRTLQPITETAVDADGQIATATQNLDCVYGRADQDGKWATSNCNINVAGQPIATAAATGAGIAANTYDFTPAQARFGSICERDV